VGSVSETYIIDFYLFKENFIWKHQRTFVLRHLTHRVYKSMTVTNDFYLKPVFFKSCTTLAVFNSVRYLIKIRRSSRIWSQIFLSLKKRTLSCKYDFGAFLRGTKKNWLVKLVSSVTERGPNLPVYRVRTVPYFFDRFPWFFLKSATFTAI
jgi:hypothetical protein